MDLSCVCGSYSGQGANFIPNTQKESFLAAIMEEMVEGDGILIKSTAYVVMWLSDRCVFL